MGDHEYRRRERTLTTFWKDVWLLFVIRRQLHSNSNVFWHPYIHLPGHMPPSVAKSRCSLYKTARRLECSLILASCQSRWSLYSTNDCSMRCSVGKSVADADNKVKTTTSLLTSSIAEHRLQLPHLLRASSLNIDRYLTVDRLMVMLCHYKIASKGRRFASPACISRSTFSHSHISSNKQHIVGRAPRPHLALAGRDPRLRLTPLGGHGLDRRIL